MTVPVVLDQDLDEGVGIGERGGIGGHHHQGVIRQGVEPENRGPQAGAGVHQDMVKGNRQGFENLPQLGLIVRAQVGHFGNSGTGREHPQRGMHLDHGFQGVGSLIQDIPHIGPHLQTQENINISQPQVAIHQQDALPLMSQGKSQVDGQAGLPHPAFPACDAPEFRFNHKTHQFCQFERFQGKRPGAPQE